MLDVEIYHQPLRPSYSILKRALPYKNAKDGLKMAVKSIKDSIGPHGLVPSSRVYGSLPILGLRLDQPHKVLFKRDNAVRKATGKCRKDIYTDIFNQH